MGPAVMEKNKRRKKIGRPSLLDLQKRSIRLQQKQQQQQRKRGGARDDNVDKSPKTDKQIQSAKATDASQQGEQSDSGPTTPLPDEKLLLFILDRLQKKDTHGVFTEPVDPDELPDYYEIIDHPMDFGTIRKKLSSGAYETLEDFENDVFLISSNGMCYNAPDTIYFRQARSIQELARKDFENLRQESSEDEPEETVRKGRHSGKSDIKKPIGKIATECGFSCDATLSNTMDNFLLSRLSCDTVRKGDKPGIMSSSTRTHQQHQNSGSYNNHNELKSNRNESCSASKGNFTRYGKHNIVSAQDNRNIYTQQQPPCNHKASVLTAFDGEKKQLAPVGLHMEHSYAWSLARFAANLGPIGWKIASKKIIKSLPPETKFGRGWVSDKNAPQSYHLSQIPLSQPEILIPSSIDEISLAPEGLEPSSNTSTNSKDHSTRMHPPFPFDSSVIGRCPSHQDVAGSPKRLNCESGLSSVGSGCKQTQNFSQHHHLHQNPLLVSSTVNGLHTSFGYTLSQVEKIARSSGQMANIVLDFSMTHAQALDLVSRSNHIICAANANLPEVEMRNLSNSSISNCNPSFIHRAVNDLDAAETNISNQTQVGHCNGLISPIVTRINHLGNPCSSENSDIHQAVSNLLKLERTKVGEEYMAKSGSILHKDALEHQGSWQGLPLYSRQESPPADINV